MNQISNLYIFKATLPEEQEACFAIRRKIFVEEQKVPLEYEIDHYDDGALHFLALHEKRPVGTARVIMKDDGQIAKIGRMAVLSEMRGKGVGAAIMQAIEVDPDVQRTNRLVLEAQTHAIPFYEKLGYVATGDEYLDCNIPHRFMSKDNPSAYRINKVPIL